jgi:hypothetical protein
VVEIPPPGAAFGTCHPLHRVNPDTPHLGEVNHQAALAYGVACDAVVAATHGHEKIVSASERDCGNPIGDACAGNHQYRGLVVHCVEDVAGLIVARIAWTEQ